MLNCFLSLSVSVQVSDAYVNVLSIIVFFSLNFSHMTWLNAERPDVCFGTSANGTWCFVSFYTLLEHVRFKLISHCQRNFSLIHVSVTACLCAGTCCSATSQKADSNNRTEQWYTGTLQGGTVQCDMTQGWTTSWAASQACSIYTHTIAYYTGRFIMYSGVTKIYYRKTVGHVFMKPVQIEGTTQKFFSK
jgi:hypothetical protein